MTMVELRHKQVHLRSVPYRRAIRWKGLRPIVNGFRWHDMERSRDGGSEASSTGNEGGQKNDVIGKVRWGAAKKALEHHNGDFELDLLANGQPVEVTQDQCDMVKLSCSGDGLAAAF